MAIIPSADTMARSTPQPGSSVASYQGGIGEGAAVQLGNAQAQFGAEVGAMAQKELDRIDETVAQDAYNKLRQKQMDLTLNPETGFVTQMRGTKALDGPAWDRYHEQFKNTASELASGMNVNQTTKFQHMSSASELNFRSDMMRHRLTETEKQHDESYAAAITVGVNSVANDPSDKNLALVTSDITRGVASKYGREHMDGPEASAEMTKALSPVYYAGIKKRLEDGDSVGAEKLLAFGKDRMTADQLLQANSVIQTAVGKRVAVTAVDAAFQGTTSMIPPPTTELMSRLWHSESGTKQLNPDGTTVIGYNTKPDGTKVEGGIGLTQITKTTAKEVAKTLGVPYDENRLRTDEKYNLLLGSTYFNQQVKKYAGDADKIIGAYKVGPGAVDTLVARYGANWKAHLPEQDQKNIDKVTTQTGKGTFVPTPTLESMQARTKANLPPNARPEVVEAALSETTRRYNAMSHDRQLVKEQVVSGAQREILNAKGDFNALSVATYQQLVDVAPEQVDNMKSFAENIASKEGPKTNPAAYNLAFTPAGQQQLAKMSEAAFLDYQTRNFSKKDQDAVLRLRAGAMGKDTTGDIDRPAVHEAVKSTLVGMGVAVDPKRGDTKAQAHLAAVTNFVMDDVTRTQRQTGKKLDDAGIRARVNTLLATNVQYRESFLGINYSDKTVSPFTKSFEDLDSGIVKAIKKSYSDRRQPVPTNEMILKDYYARYVSR